MSDFLASLAATPARWISGKGPLAPIVHSTRIRLARNLDFLPFPPRADAGVMERVKEEARKLVDRAPLLRGIVTLDLDRLGPLDREFLFERHLVSREFAQGTGRLLLVDPGENVAIMVNEEDHFRLQALRSGLDVFEAWQCLRAIEREIDAHLDFAFRPPYGYLTACPTNLGTGLRVSALCHLPALVVTNGMNEVIDLANQVGVAVRGFYGEGSTAVGSFFQFSNRASLGESEEEIVSEIEGWVKQIVERETQARAAILQNDRLGLEDKAHRAIGILGAARVMTSGEMMNLLSLVRLGVDTGIVERPDAATLNRIQLTAQPAHLQRREGKALSPLERDAARARFIREALGA